MENQIIIAFVIVAITIVAIGAVLSIPQALVIPTPTPTPSPSATPTPSATPSATPTATPTPTPIPLPSALAGLGIKRNIEIQSFLFHPSDITIVRGTTVTWLNLDSAMHTIAADDGSFTSDNLKNGDKFTYKFDTPGDYGYHCATHTSMKGTIKVI